MKDLVGRFKPEIIILQESKLVVISDSTVRCLCQFDNPGWIALLSVGATGGVLLI